MIHNRIQPLPVHADTDGGFGHFLVATGYDFHAGPVIFGPVASLEFTHVTIDSFSEKAVVSPRTEFISGPTGLSPRAAAKLADPLLKVEPQDVDSLKSTLGLTASLPMVCHKVHWFPSLTVAWQHESMDQQYGINAVFPFAPGDPFTVHGPAFGRDNLLVQAAVTIRVSDRVSLYASYEGEFGRQNYASHIVQGGAQVLF